METVSSESTRIPSLSCGRIVAIATTLKTTHGPIKPVSLVSRSVLVGLVYRIGHLTVNIELAGTLVIESKLLVALSSRSSRRGLIKVHVVEVRMVEVVHGRR